MIPLQITAEEFVKYHEPASDYLYAVRKLENYDKIGRVALPDTIRKTAVRFLPSAKLLKISSAKSYTPDGSLNAEIESKKETLRKATHIMFEYHAVADVKLMPQFEFPTDISVIMLHVKEVVAYGVNIEELLEKQSEYEKKEEASWKTPPRESLIVKS